MSATAASAPRRRDTGTVRAIETTVLVIVGVILAVATVNDVGRQVQINHRLIADLRTWRQYTGHDYRNISIDSETLGLDSEREILCGNTTPGPPGARTQVCLAIWGPIRKRRAHRSRRLVPAAARRRPVARTATAASDRAYGECVRDEVQSMSAAAAIPATARARRPAQAVARLPAWWPLAALTLLAAVLRLSTLDLQSFWYDEAFTPVHVLHASLAATLRSVVHTENSPPLWYVLEWADARVLGTGEVALRLPSALAGIATVPVAWAIGRELAYRPRPHPPAAPRSSARRSSRSTRCSCGTRRRRASTRCSCSPPRLRCCASCGRYASRRRDGWPPSR